MQISMNLRLSREFGTKKFALFFKRPASFNLPGRVKTTGVQSGRTVKNKYGEVQKKTQNRTYGSFRRIVLLRVGTWA